MTYLSTQSLLDYDEDQITVDTHSKPYGPCIENSQENHNGTPEEDSKFIRL